MAEKLNNPHDRFFRENFSRREVAEGFLRSYLPAAIVQNIEWETLEAAKDSFVEKALRNHFSDLLYTVQHSARQIKIYLLVEHKSHPDDWVALQLLRYQVRIWELHRKQHPKLPLPPILPLVLYHGRQPWQTSTHFSSLFGELGNELHNYLPDFRYTLCDLNLPEPAKIREALLSRLVLLALKHIFDPTPKQALADLIPLIREILDRETAMEMLEVLLHYYVQTTQVLDEEDIRELISTDEEDLMQTFIDRYIEQGKQQGWIGGRQEGRQEGKQEGKQEGQKELLLRLLTRKFGPLTEHHHHRVEQANGETLLRWSEQTLFASTVEEALK